MAGAGFYVDATEAKWRQYRMYSYVTTELPSLLRAEAPALDFERVSLMGHSMGGHGALIMGLRNAGAFKSISAVAPICNPMKCPWGEKGAPAGLTGAVLLALLCRTRVARQVPARTCHVRVRASDQCALPSPLANRAARSEVGGRHALGAQDTIFFMLSVD